MPRAPGHRRHVCHLFHVAVLLFAVACGRHEPRSPRTPPEKAVVPLSVPALGGGPMAGTFLVDEKTAVVVAPSYPGADAAALVVARQLAAWLGLPDSAARVGGEERGIVLDLDLPLYIRDRADERGEGFELAVTEEGARIEAQDLAGLFYGAQTFAQLAGARRIVPTAAPRPPHRVPCAVLYDGPLHPFRAMHLDVARHFFGRDVVERYLDLLAFYRFNVLHLHLTDDQGFRFDVKKRPELASKDGKYTEEDLRTIVKLAEARHITVIPEIDMPGHTRAILASHPELSCQGKPLPVPTTWGIFEDVLCPGNEDTFVLVRDVLEEVARIFPSRVIHIGGDEVPLTRWSACPKCAARMKAEKTDAHGLGSYFHKRVAAIVRELGREPAVWDEALDAPAIADEAIVFAWRSKQNGERAAKLGHRVVMAPNETTYFDRRQTRGQTGPGMEGHTSWQQVASFDPIPAGLHPAQAERILGGEGLLWTEYVKTQDEIESLVLPRMAALAGALWGYRFEGIFATQRAMLDASRVMYFVEPPSGLRDKKVFLDEATVSLAPSPLFVDGVVRYTTDGSEPNATSPSFTAPFKVQATTKLAARTFLSGGRTSDVVRGVLEKQTPRPAVTPPAGLRNGVGYKYYEGDFVVVPDFAKLTPKEKGRIPENARFGLLATFRPEHFAVLYEGFFYAPADGVYRFVARADDGVRLSVDGEEILADDGPHPARETDGEIALATGVHTFRLGYFQGARGKELELSCEGPSGAGLSLFAP